MFSALLGETVFFFFLDETFEWVSVTWTSKYYHLSFIFIMLFCNVMKEWVVEDIIKNAVLILRPYGIKQRPKYGLQITNSSSWVMFCLQKARCAFWNAVPWYWKRKVDSPLENLTSKKQLFKQVLKPQPNWECWDLGLVHLGSSSPLP